MGDVNLDSTVFFSRATRLFDDWKASATDPDFESFKEIQHIAVVVGDAEEDAGVPKKGVAVQTWLLGYEFPSTIIVFSKAADGSKPTITFVTSQSKAKLLDVLTKSSSISVETVIRPKDATAGAKVIKEYVESLTASGSVKIGNFAKDTFKGKLADDWTKAVTAAGDKLQLEDVTSSISSVLAVKDGQEIKQHTTAARLCTTIMGNYFKQKMEAIIDKEAKISHEQLATLVEEKLGNDNKGPDMKVWKQNPRLGAESLDFSNSDWIYTPIIQSGGKYDLKVSAQSDGGNLKPGIILASMGIKYKEYCANIGRTFLISPDKTQEGHYSFVLELHQHILKLMKSGAIVKDIYTAAQKYVADKRPALSDYFPKNLGYGTGIDFRDGAYLINSKCTKTLKENMTFVLTIGFADLPEAKSASKKYALQLTDTVRVGQESGILLTEGTKKLHEVALDEGDDDASVEDVKPVKDKKSASKLPPKSPVKGTVVGNKVLRAKTRGQDKAVDESAAQQQKEHQAELHEKIQARGLKKYKNGADGKTGDQGKVFKKFESYKREDQIPSAVKDKRIFVDEARNTVLLPIYGMTVPFHISTIKNVSKTEEGDFTVLRVNFQSPGQILGRKEDTPFEDPNATFVRSATFRSPDARHMAKVSEQITNMRKAQNKRETDRRELADVVEQEKLIEMKARRPHKLVEVQIRPPLDNKRNVPGELEIHTNGCRYYSAGGQRVDILFSNVKHLFFQPCDHEMHVILHFHLKAPIMINGKKKAKDIQFIREISDQAFDETGNRKRKSRYGDEDEIEQEQEERKRRQQLNREFQAFAGKISETSEAVGQPFDPDIPFRELGFSGVPFRSNVLLQPTTDCLVHLTDNPFLVVTLSEIEVVHLERVQFGLKNFDMVLVFSDFSKPPVHINSIPMESLDDVKGWLDSVEIATSEGPVNLSWPAIMKTINDDPTEFFKMGGWNFLTGGDDDDATSSEEESDFEAESIPDEDSDSSDDDDDEFDASDESDDDGDDDDESGEDWDEMEKKAKAEDAEMSDESEDDRKKKKKSSSSKGGRR